MDLHFTEGCFCCLASWCSASPSDLLSGDREASLLSGKAQVVAVFSLFRCSVSLTDGIMAFFPIYFHLVAEGWRPL